ncbi:putative quinol monooxygenase [uncultured Clostridium sp.]|uniref:putative quinol monooxygenase n=1 Tax=uncultured Clostridium sp. TaxID=59620 RepID=UPI0032168AFD
MITIVAKKTIKKDKKEEFKNLANKLIEESRKENGCIEYDLYEEFSNSNVVAFIEVWKNEEAINSHNNTRHFTTIVPELAKFQEGETEITLYKKI